MIATLLLAVATAFPARGSYTYEIETPVRQYSTTVVITLTNNGVTTHEAFGAPTPTATTEQSFDSGLHELAFSAQQAGRDGLTITFAQSQAVYNIAGHTHRLVLDAPECLLVSDNVLTSMVMLPSVVRATGASDCTYVLSTAVQAEKAYVLDTAPNPRPSRAAPGDASITIDLSGRHETVWYDPKTLIPDYIDFGEAVGDAVLVR